MELCRMGFWSDLGRGISSHGKAFEFIAKHNLWLYFLYPALILTLLWLAGFASTFALGDYLAEELMTATGLDSTSEDWTGMLGTILRLVASFALKALLFFLFASYIKYIVLIFCSPIMALLSERVEEITTGKTYPFHFGQFIKDIGRGVLVTLRNMLIETACIVACLVVAWIPVIGWLTIPFLWIIAWYFLGYSMMDYTFERKRLSLSQGTSFVRKHKGIAIGNGFIFSMLLYIPFLGVIVSPVLSATAGTLATLETMKEEEKV
jgi:CysZ protein